MSAIALRKLPGGALAAADDFALEVMKRWKAGDLVLAEVRKPRNPRFHRKFFALLNLAFDCQEIYTDRELFRKAVLLEAQVSEPLMLPGGVLVHTPKSLSFGSMDEIEFGKVYSKCLTVICEKFVSGQDADEMNANVEMLLEGFA